MSSFSTELPAARMLVDELNFQLQQLEEESDSSDTLKTDASRNLNTLQRTVAKLQADLTPEHRAVWKPRVDGLDADYKLLRKSLEKYLSRAHAETSNTRAREALFGPSGGARAVAVDDLAKEAESLTRSNHMVSEYIEHGKGMLASLQAQGATLKGAHRKVLDIASTLGISQNLMNVIRRRTTTDQYLVYLGMIAVLFLFYLIIHYA